jgi:hypothetical protein
MFMRKSSESDRSDGQWNFAHQHHAYRWDGVSSDIPNRDLSLTAAPLASGRFFIVVRAGANALWRSVGAAALRCQSAGPTEQERCCCQLRAQGIHSRIA